MLKRFVKRLWDGDLNFHILVLLFLIAVTVGRPAKAADVFIVGMFLFVEMNKRAAP